MKQARSRALTPLIVTPLLVGWAAIAVPSLATAQSQYHYVNIVDGVIDVDLDWNTAADPDDSLQNVLLLVGGQYGGCAPTKVDIIGGLVDVTENGTVSIEDDLMNLGIRLGKTNQFKTVAVVNGFVDVDGGGISYTDDYYGAFLLTAPFLSKVEADVINGSFDVNGDGHTAADNLTDVLMCFDFALTRVDIIGGKVDVNEGGLANGTDDLFSVYLATGSGSTLVDILDGGVDVDRSGHVSIPDDLSNVKLLRGSRMTRKHVDIVAGEVDLDGNGIDTNDDARDVLLALPGMTPYRVDIIDGRFDVNEDGDIDSLDWSYPTNLNDLYQPNSAQFRDGGVDINLDGWVDSDDNATDVYLVMAPPRSKPLP